MSNIKDQQITQLKLSSFVVYMAFESGNGVIALIIKKLNNNLQK